MPSDEEFAEALCGGSSDALREIFSRHGGAVFDLARSIVEDPSAVEDISQEVFTRLWRAPGGFDPERGTLRTYLLTSCHSRAIDLVRHEASRRRREQLDASRQEPLNARSTEDVLDLRDVGLVLEQLPERERVPITMAYFGGATYRDVAVDLELSEGTVKSRIRSGLRRMRSDPALQRLQSL